MQRGPKAAAVAAGGRPRAEFGLASEQADADNSPQKPVWCVTWEWGCEVGLSQGNGCVMRDDDHCMMKTTAA